jgi:hypothetical protein
MADTPTGDPPASDPDNVAEILCVGKFNITAAAPLITLTFTHNRPKAGPLLDASTLEFETVVRARIVTTMENVVALRDVLIRLTEAPQPPPVTSGGATLN